MASDNITSMQEVASATQEVASATRDVEGRLRQGCADMKALCRGNVGAAMAASQAAVCGAQEITSTLLAFLQSRAKDSLAAGQQLAACDSPEALLEVQVEYAKAMLQAYADEFERLHALTGRILADVLVPVKSRTLSAPTRATTAADALAA